MKSALPVITFCFLLFTGSIKAQEEKKVLINGSFENLTLIELFRNIESRSPYFFYYNEQQLDSIKVNIIAKDETLQSVLEKAFKNTDLLFSIDDKNRVYITKGLRVVTTLPTGFFRNNAVVKPALAIKDSIIDFGLETGRKQKVTSESKLHEIGARTNAVRGNSIVTGVVRNARSGEPLINASVFINNNYSAVTDAYGNYSLTVPAGKHTLNIMSIGMKDTKLQLAVYSDGKLDIDIREQVTTLKEVIVSSKKLVNINRVQMGVERLSIESIRRVPSVFGEADVLRVITSLPGVKTVGEASTGFNVRGGSADQNLILYNDATIFNPSHFFGMFSAFNPEVIKDVELYKSSIPARFGGRLASVLDINSREGNKKTIAGSAGIGPVTSRVHLEGPIAKDKTSFIFGGRSTYANWLLNLLPDEYEDSKAGFQDINLGISHRVDSTSNIHFSGYFSNDKFSLDSDTVYSYTNRNATIKWLKSFNNRLSAAFVAGFDEYKYKVHREEDKETAFKLQFGINQLHAKANFTYYLNQQHSFEFGLNSIYYKLQPGSYDPFDKNSIIASVKVENEQALESGIYFAHRYSPGNKLSLSSGIRFSMFNYMGPQTVNYYAPGLPMTEDNLVDVKEFEKGKFIKTYSGPEIRFSARYAFTTDFSVKAAYNSQRQYIHMLSNTTAIAPTDIWKLSDVNIKPQQGDQVSVGLYKNFKSNTIETSVEVYYKRIKDYLDYKPGAKLILNETIETDVINTKGKAYGVELLIKKPGGKLNGWISYTYSRILLRTDADDPDIRVNRGEYYPANYDKPHDVTLAGNFRINHRFSVSLNSTYSTGRPITLPIGRYYYAGSERVLYSDRNSHRIPDYIRTDFSMNIEGNHKVHQKTHNSWTIGMYNLFGRNNPYSVYFISQNGLISGYKFSIFGNMIPFVNFNIRF
jgi:hypothetical protein